MGLYVENIVHLSLLVISRVVLMRHCQFSRAVIEVYNMVERCVPKYGL